MLEYDRVYNYIYKLDLNSTLIKGQNQRVINDNEAVNIYEIKVQNHDCMVCLCCASFFSFL
jgi:hypothetical protein